MNRTVNFSTTLSDSKENYKKLLYFQSPYNEEVKTYVAEKLQESSGIDSEKYLYFILLASAFFFLLSISMTIYMVIRRRRKNIVKAKDTILIEKYQNFLSSMLILPVDEAFLGIQKSNRNEYRLDPCDIKKNHNRMVLAKEIYTLKKDISGSQESQLTNYFFGLGLQNEVIKMLKSRSLVNKMQAMKMIQSFNIEECQEAANKYIHSKDRDLAILAIQNRIKYENSIHVLYDLKVKLNDWECHKIIHTIRSAKIAENEILNLKRSIHNGNINLSRLSVGLIKKKKATLILQ